MQSSLQPTYAQIVAKLAADIESGVLTPGERLPTHRALAHRLGVALGTVTRAYASAQAQGLIEAVVGRGSFVARGRATPAHGRPIDLSRNIPPLGPTTAALRRAYAALARRGDLGERLDYAPDGGFPADRRAGAAWLRRTANFSQAHEWNLMVCAGAQQAIAVALATFCRPGEALIMEEATFHGAKLAAEQAGLGLVPAVMDAEGLTPDGLDQAAASGARAAYVQPFQNPTARVMGLGRRQAIIETARRRGIMLIEDDLYGPHAAHLGLPPLAELAPEQVAYVSGLSKSLAPGLRTGYLIVPDNFRGPALAALRAIAFGAPTFGAALASHWIESGEAFDVLEAVRRELAERTSLARAKLIGRADPIRLRGTTHLWLPLGELEAERIAGQAFRAGVQVTSPRAPFVGETAVSGLRLCLGGASDLAELERGLAILAGLLSAWRAPVENIV